MTGKQLTLGGPVSLTEPELLERVSGMQPLRVRPLELGRINLLDSISQKILAHPTMRQSPQHIALAYWLRRAAVTKLANKWLSHLKLPEAFLIPRGLALHLPPTNVDTIFVFSWAISVLVGNKNVVRLPTDLDALTLELVHLILEVLDHSGESGQHLFFSFPHDGQILAELSAMADVRMIWGGDAKVDAVSRLPTKLDGLSIGFPDRRSFAIISLGSYQKANNELRDRLAQDFFNDMFWFDQMACGSPRMAIWVGGDAASAQSELIDFGERIQAIVSMRGHSVQTSTAVAKMVAAYGLLADGAAMKMHHMSNSLAMVEMKNGQVTADVRQGGGFLLSTWVDVIEAASIFVGPMVQTITHFGFERAELEKFAISISHLGGYRIVPIGKALNFGEIWDGVPLFSHLTRNIVLET